MSSPAPLEIVSAVGPAGVGRARRALREWLRAAITRPGRDLDEHHEDLLDDLVLATSEALENVVDHAFAGSEEAGTMRLRAEVADGTVTVVVADDGSWRAPRLGPTTRGRGLTLMDRLTDAVVERGSRGTVVTLRRGLTVPAHIPAAPGLTDAPA